MAAFFSPDAPGWPAPRARPQAALRSHQRGHLFLLPLPATSRAAEVFAVSAIRLRTFPLFDLVRPDRQGPARHPPTEPQLLSTGAVLGPPGYVEALAEAVASRLRRAGPSCRLLTKSAAANLIGVGRTRTLQRLIDTGAIRTVMVGKRARIPLTEIERFQAEGEGPAPAPAAARKPPARPVSQAHPRPGNLADQLAEVRKMRI